MVVDVPQLNYFYFPSKNNTVGTASYLCSRYIVMTTYMFIDVNYAKTRLPLHLCIFEERAAHIIASIGVPKPSSAIV